MLLYSIIMKSYNFLVKMLIYGRNKDYFTLLYLVSGWTVSLLSYTTVQVILARDGSHLFISCNRLLGLPVSPECVTTTTTSTTTTPTTAPQHGLARDRKDPLLKFMFCYKYIQTYNTLQFLSM